MVVKKILGRIIPRSLQAHRREVDEIPKSEYYAKRLVEEDREPLKTFVESLGEKFEERGKQVMIVALGSSVLEYEARREHHHHDKEGNLKQDRTYLDIDLSVFPIDLHTLSTWKPIVHQVVSNVVTDSHRGHQPRIFYDQDISSLGYAPVAIDRHNEATITRYLPTTVVGLHSLSFQLPNDRKVDLYVGYRNDRLSAENFLEAERNGKPYFFEGREDASKFGKLPFSVLYTSASPLVKLVV